jgi:hypothetical protein
LQGTCRVKSTPDEPQAFPRDTKALDQMAYTARACWPTHLAEPVQGPVGGFRVLARVFEKVPDPKEILKEAIPDNL